ncbi:MAG: hypothetical protein H0T62_06050 [Parachlamydiaceae bacterium]|nr:hypothetical protein [Parachlamydiaceae bacterium]
MSTPTGSIGSTIISFLTGGTTTALPTSDPFAIDSQSNSTQQAPQLQALNLNAPVLSPPVLTLIEYARIVNTALNNLKEQVNISDTSSMLLNIDMWLENAAWARSLTALKSSLTALSIKELSTFKGQLTDSLKYNQKITTYNSVLTGLDPALTAMNLLQQQLAADPTNQAKKDAYAAAVTTWNTLLPARNAQVQTAYAIYSAATTAFNLQVDANNAKITAINAQRTILGITDLLKLEEPAVLKPIYLLPTLTAATPTPTVPAIIPKVPPYLSTGAVSTTIVVTPATPAEQAFLDSISSSLNAINSGPGAAYNNYLVSTDDNVAVMSQAIVDYQLGLITTAQYNTKRDAYLSFASTANNQLSTLGQNYINAINNYNGSNNSKIDAQNVTIDAFNITRISLGQEPIPRQVPLEVPNINSALLITNIPQGPPPPATNPLTNSPTVLLPPAPKGSKTPVTSKTYLAQYFTPAYDESLASLAAYTKNLENQGDYRAYILFTLAGGLSNVLPNAYIDLNPEVTFDPSAQGASISGVALTAMIVGLSSKTLTATIASSVFSAINGQIDGRLPQGVVDNALLFALSSLQEAKLLSAMPALSVLSRNIDTLFKGSPAVSAALALNDLLGISSLIESGAIEKAITDYLIEAGVSATDIEAVAKSLTAALGIGILQFELFSAAMSLNLPGLLLQVLGNLSDADVRKLLVSSSAKGFGDVLNDPVSVLALKSTLVKDLVAKTGIQEDIAKAQIQRALDKTLAQKDALRTEAQFKAALRQNLKDVNIDEQVTIDLSDEASTFVKTDLIVQDINTGFLKDSLLSDSLERSQQVNDAIKSVLQNNEIQTKRQLHEALVAELVKTNSTAEEAIEQANQVLLSLQSDELKNSFASDRIDKDLLTASLISANKSSNLPESSQDATKISQAVTDTLALNLKSDFQFREALAANLKAQGIANSDLLAAQSAVAITGNNPLTSPIPGDFLDRDQLAEKLTTEIIKFIGPSANPAVAEDLAKQLALAIVGPAPSNELVSDEIRRPGSALNLLITAYENLRETDAASYGVAVSENFRDTIKPTIELFLLAARLNDPGTQLFLSASSIFAPQFGKKKGYIDIAA